VARLALGVLAVGAIAAVTPACASDTEKAPIGDGEDDYTRRKGKLQLVVTVDWEGRDLREDNIRAMENLHARFPQVKVVHFLNAGYYTKQFANRADVTARMNRAIKPGDEKALHIHGWRRLFEASGLTFRNTPTFWGTTIDPRSRECLDDCGHEVPISLYTTDELRKVVNFSLDTLEQNGFGRAKSFRCGGWMDGEDDGTRCHRRRRTHVRALRGAGRVSPGEARDHARVRMALRALAGHDERLAALH
jgi:hypothetical protein